METINPPKVRSYKEMKPFCHDGRRASSYHFFGRNEELMEVL